MAASEQVHPHARAQLSALASYASSRRAPSEHRYLATLRTAVRAEAASAATAKVLRHSALMRWGFNLCGGGQYTGAGSRPRHARRHSSRRKSGDSVRSYRRLSSLWRKQEPKIELKWLLSRGSREQIGRRAESAPYGTSSRDRSADESDDNCPCHAMRLFSCRSRCLCWLSC